MKTRIAIGTLALMVVLALSANAGGKGELQKYFNTAAAKVKAAENPSEKRTILNESFQRMSNALEIVQQSPIISTSDRVGIDRFKASLREKQDELAGINGFVRVSDQQLNSFSDYVVQDLEQADQIISLSLVSLLLIIILIVLLV